MGFSCWVHLFFAVDTGDNRLRNWKSAGQSNKQKKNLNIQKYGITIIITPSYTTTDYKHVTQDNETKSG